MDGFAKRIKAARAQAWRDVEDLLKGGSQGYSPVEMRETWKNIMDGVQHAADAGQITSEQDLIVELMAQAQAALPETYVEDYEKKRVETMFIMFSIAGSLGVDKQLADAHPKIDRPEPPQRGGRA